MKIYSKTGDKGKTSLIGGTRVSKSDDRLEAYGTIDELMAWTGLIRDQLDNDQFKATLLEILDRLMTTSSLLATAPGQAPTGLPKLIPDDVKFIERAIDEMEIGLPSLHSFLLPGGHILVSHCHIARTVCRRAERAIIRLSENFNVDELIIRFLNRLSDYYFTLSRRLSSDLQSDELIWTPRLKY